MAKYSEETIKKVIEGLKEKINFYKAVPEEDIKMAISSGNKKIGHVLNVSLAPVITCKNCKECKYFCYDIKAVLAYPSCMDARARNTALFMKNRDEFFRRLHDKMSCRKKNKYLRFHVSGEIIDIDHFSRMVETAKKFPDFTVWTYTKVYWIVNEYVKQHGGSIAAAIPSNFHVMFSEWKGLPIVNPYEFPVFRCQFREEGPLQGVWQCPGNCNVCKACNRGCVNGETSWCYDH